MPLEEVVDSAEVSAELVGIMVVVGEVVPQEASAMLRLLADRLPLERFGLAHLVGGGDSTEHPCLLIPVSLEASEEREETRLGLYIGAGDLSGRGAADGRRPDPGRVHEHAGLPGESLRAAQEKRVRGLGEHVAAAFPTHRCR